MICNYFPEIGGEEEGRSRRAGTARRLVNRVVEATVGRNAGEAPSATTRQILRESRAGQAARNLLGRIRGRRRR
jgi:hypothetical protein